MPVWHILTSARIRPITERIAVMNRLLTCTIAVLLLSGSACGQDQASQLLETAQFEERQTNLTHAKELYEDILRQYPDSPAAKTARARLADLAGK